MIEDLNNNEDIIAMCDIIKNDLINTLNNHKEEVIQKLDNTINNFYETFTNQIDDYTNAIENKVIKFDIKKLKSPRLVKLPKTNDTNFLINLILQCLCNIKPLILYFLNPEKEEKIFKKSREDKTGTYLSPQFFDLIINVYKRSNNVYNPIKLHDKLKKLMNDDYNSDNPGTIIKFIIDQLHKELKNNESSSEDPEFNIDKKSAFNIYRCNFTVNLSKISEEFYSSIKIIITSKEGQQKYLYEAISVFDLNLSNSKKENLDLKKDFKVLFIDKDIKEKYCKNNEEFNTKETKTISNVFIININRNKDQKQYLEYPFNLQDIDLIEQKYNNIREFELKGVIIIKNINNENIYYAYIKSFVNKKWYLFDDNNIELVEDENKVIDKENASLLIYKHIQNNTIY